MVPCLDGRRAVEAVWIGEILSSSLLCLLLPRVSVWCRCREQGRIGGEWVGCFGSGLGGLLVCGVSWQGLRLVGVRVERVGVGVGVRVVVLLLFTVVWSGCWPTSDTTPIGRVFFLVRITLRTAQLWCVSV